MSFPKISNQLLTILINQLFSCSITNLYLRSRKGSISKLIFVGSVRQIGQFFKIASHQIAQVSYNTDGSQLHVYYSEFFISYILYQNAYILYQNACVLHNQYFFVIRMGLFYKTLLHGHFRQLTTRLKINRHLTGYFNTKS